ncbi:MAG: twin-arginine translocase TatA/TatE family subunit [Puniceicoccaceae bacterium]|nr:MAG: twin-arginine translocase TatA/TatE family subunit [Puniceicoccaceae bacterium]
MNTIAFLQNINGPEILLIFLVVLLLFGAKRLPELAKSFGKSIREFKKATSDIENDIRTAMDEEPSKPSTKVDSEAKKDTTPKQVESANNEAAKDEAATKEVAKNEKA